MASDTHQLSLATSSGAAGMYGHVSQVTTMFHTTLTPGNDFADPGLQDPKSQCPQPAPPEEQQEAAACDRWPIVKSSSGLAAPRSLCSRRGTPLARRPAARERLASAGQRPCLL